MSFRLQWRSLICGPDSYLVLFSFWVLDMDEHKWILVMGNHGFQLQCLCNQLKSKHLGIPVKNFLDYIVWGERNHQKCRVKGSPKETHPDLKPEPVKERQFGPETRPKETQPGPTQKSKKHTPVINSAWKSTSL